VFIFTNNLNQYLLKQTLNNRTLIVSLRVRLSIGSGQDTFHQFQKSADNSFKGLVGVYFYQQPQSILAQPNAQ